MLINTGYANLLHGCDFLVLTWWIIIKKSESRRPKIYEPQSEQELAEHEKKNPFFPEEEEYEIELFW